MSTTGLQAFDKTLQETNHWLKLMMGELGTDSRSVAFGALRASLHALRDRVGVWSIYRNGHPAKGAEAFRLCLRRTVMVAAHETGHILTMQHCTAHRCLMNGVNHQTERDSRPLTPCPVCLRKLCWNLQVEPVAYLRWLEAFCRTQGGRGGGVV